MKLSLLTFNGKCDNENLTLRPVTDQKLVTKYKIRKVRNFITFAVDDLGINVFLYARGGFKITLKSTTEARSVIKKIDLVLRRLVDILQFFYGVPIDRFEVNLTQISLITGNLPGENLGKISYQDLIKTRKYNCNQLTYEFQNFTIIHDISWEKLEDGCSNYYFKILDESAGDEKSVGGFKLYNNFKTVLFVHNIDYLTDFIRIVKIFTDRLRGVLFPVALTREQSSDESNELCELCE